MIKKTTKITFEDTGETIEDTGGIPLSEGESLMIAKDGVNQEYVVSSKEVNCRKEGEDWLAEVVYRLRRK